MISSVFYSKDGHKVTAIWKQTESIVKFKPLTQAYAVCFTKEGKVLVARDNKRWTLPGGTIEAGETPRDALLRELDEEVNIEVLACKPLGVQELHYPNNPNKKFGETFYQSRWVVIIEKLKKRAPDPCNGRIFTRKFVNPAEFHRYIDWGPVHKEVFRLAYAAFLNWKKNGRL